MTLWLRSTTPLVLERDEQSSAARRFQFDCRRGSCGTSHAAIRTTCRPPRWAKAHSPASSWRPRRTSASCRGPSEKAGYNANLAEAGRGDIALRETHRLAARRVNRRQKETIASRWRGGTARLEAPAVPPGRKAVPSGIADPSAMPSARYVDDENVHRAPRIASRRPVSSPPARATAGSTRSTPNYQEAAAVQSAERRDDHAASSIAPIHPIAGTPRPNPPRPAPLPHRRAKRTARVGQGKMGSRG